MWSVRVDGHIENQETLNLDVEARICCIERKKYWAHGVSSTVSALLSAGIILAMLKAAGVFNG